MRMENHYLGKVNGITDVDIEDYIFYSEIIELMVKNCLNRAKSLHDDSIEEISGKL